MSSNLRQLGLIIAATIALFTLVFLQFRWMSYSRTLVEQQFDAKVNMAIRSAVNEIYQQYPAGVSFDFANPYDQSLCGKSILESNFTADELRNTLDQSFSNFDIALDYSYSIRSLPTGLYFPFSESNSFYSCRLDSDSELLQIQFFGKEDYVRTQLAWMTLLTTVFIILAISLFLLTVRQWVKQKKLNQWNVDFFNNMAHEFRTPLTNMKLALGLLKRKSDLSDDNTYLQILQKENAHLFNQVERVLDISKLEKEQLMLRMEPFSLSVLCGQIVQQMQIIVQEKNGTILADLPAEKMMINGDKLHISNAIRNIIDNACKYNLETPKIELHLSRTNQFVCVTISDNGIGIPKKHQKAIFQRFFRIHEGNPSAIKGFGLGLTYVKKVVEQHAGMLKLKSIPRSGSTFQLFFPQQQTI